MKKWTSLMVMLGLISFVTLGCGGDKDGGTDGNGGGTSATDGSQPPVPTATLVAASYEGQKICGNCGHAYPAGEEHNCDDGHTACEKCGFHEGTALCCQTLTAEDAKDKQYCGNCGQVAGSENCCAPDAKKCEKCGFHAGSDLCCRIKPKA